MCSKHIRTGMRRTRLAGSSALTTQQPSDVGWSKGPTKRVLYCAEAILDQITWTTDTPKEPGIYLTRPLQSDPDSYTRVRRLFDHLGVMIVENHDGDTYYAQSLSVYWSQRFAPVRANDPLIQAAADCARWAAEAKILLDELAMFQDVPLNDRPDVQTELHRLRNAFTA